MNITYHGYEMDFEKKKQIRIGRYFYLNAYVESQISSTLLKKINIMILINYLISRKSRFQLLRFKNVSYHGNTAHVQYVPQLKIVQ